MSVFGPAFIVILNCWSVELTNGYVALSMKKLKRLLGIALQPLRIVGSKLLGALIPLHARRILFTVSLYFALSKETYPGEKTLKRLNKSLQLAKDPNALELPARLHNLFWSGRLDEILDEIKLTDLLQNQDPMQVELFCSILVNSTPHWMRYGRRTDMIHDVKRVLERNTVELKSRGLLPTT